MLFLAGGAFFAAAFLAGAFFAGAAFLAAGAVVAGAAFLAGAAVAAGFGGVVAGRGCVYDGVGVLPATRRAAANAAAPAAQIQSSHGVAVGAAGATAQTRSSVAVVVGAIGVGTAIGGSTSRNAGISHNAYAAPAPKIRRTGARSSITSAISKLVAISTSTSQALTI